MDRTLRHKVTIEQLTETQDSLGAVIESWSTVVTTRALVEPLSGREYFTAKQVNSEAKYKLKLRYQAALSSLNTKMRVVWGAVVFDIDSIPSLLEPGSDIVIYCHD
jgi:SPP1 family predicted phage head-tail adaptor